MKRLSLLAVALLSLVAVVSVACGGSDDDMDMDAHMPTSASSPSANTPVAGVPGAEVITVKLSNWKIEPSKASTAAGKVTFKAIHDAADAHSHDGAGAIHDLAVAKKRSDGSWEVLGQVKDLKMGEQQDLTLDLTPGEYELQCNAVEEIGKEVVAHYPKGMKTGFKVN